MSGGDPAASVAKRDPFLGQLRGWPRRGAEDSQAPTLSVPPCFRGELAQLPVRLGIRPFRGLRRGGLSPLSPQPRCARFASSLLFSSRRSGPCSRPLRPVRCVGPISCSSSPTIGAGRTPARWVTRSRRLPSSIALRGRESSSTTRSARCRPAHRRAPACSRVAPRTNWPTRRACGASSTAATGSSPTCCGRADMRSA